MSSDVVVITNVVSKDGVSKDVVSKEVVSKDVVSKDVVSKDDKDWTHYPGIATDLFEDLTRN